MKLTTTLVLVVIIALLAPGYTTFCHAVAERQKGGGRKKTRSSSRQDAIATQPAWSSVRRAGEAHYDESSSSSGKGSSKSSKSSKSSADMILKYLECDEKADSEDVLIDVSKCEVTEGAFAGAGAWCLGRGGIPLRSEGFDGGKDLLECCYDKDVQDKIYNVVCDDPDTTGCDDGPDNFGCSDDDCVGIRVPPFYIDGEVAGEFVYNCPISFFTNYDDLEIEDVTAAQVILESP